MGLLLVYSITASGDSGQGRRSMEKHNLTEKYTYRVEWS
jgi:hypothetical protein